jgi:hypothetical protein
MSANGCGPAERRVPCHPLRPGWRSEEREVVLLAEDGEVHLNIPAPDVTAVLTPIELAMLCTALDETQDEAASQTVNDDKPRGSNDQ